MKFNKTIISSVVLSAIGAAALVSCGKNSPNQTPSILVYARTSSLGNTKKGERAINIKNPEIAIDETVYYDDDVLSYTVDNAENLKYGEDVTIHITPKPFFHLTQSYNKEEWTPGDDPVIPYVGLGSPTNPFSYPLPRDVAWTYTRDDSETESYTLKVHKDFFKKNIVIAYGYQKDGKLDETNCATVVSSDIYESFYCMSLAEVDEDFKKGDKVLSLDGGETWNTKFNTSLIRSAVDASVVSDGLTIKFNRESGAFGHDLVSFASVPNTFEDDERVYSQIKVYGVHTKEDSGEIVLNGKPEEMGYIPLKEGGPTFTAYNPNSLSNQLSVLIEWKYLADLESLDYAPKYDTICVALDPTYECNVECKAKPEITTNEEKISHIINGYVYPDGVEADPPRLSNIKNKPMIKKDYSGSPFRPNEAIIDTTTDADKTYDIVPYMIADEDYSNGYSIEDVGYFYNQTTYFATFKYTINTTLDRSTWPTIDIKYTNGGGSSMSRTINSSNTIQKHVRDSDTTVEYKTDISNYWQLVRLTVDEEKSAYFALYPTYNCRYSAFYPKGEYDFAQNVEISIE